VRDNALNPIDEAPNLPFQGELGAFLGFVFIDSAMFCRIMLLIGSSPSWVIETKRTPFLASLRTQNSKVEVVTEEAAEPVLENDIERRRLADNRRFDVAHHRLDVGHVRYWQEARCPRGQQILADEAVGLLLSPIARSTPPVIMRTHAGRAPV